MIDLTLLFFRVGLALVGFDVLFKPLYQLFYLKRGFGHRRPV